MTSPSAKRSAEPADIESASVIVPAFNRQHLIGDALDSILRQRFQPLEIIVVDDGSSDATSAVAASFGESVRCVRQDQAGVSRARNRGLAEANGTWIAFLDSDDVWIDAVLATAIAHLRSEPDCWMVQGLTEIVRMKDAGDRRPRFREGEAPSYRPILGSIVCRRECFELNGEFDETLHASEDLDWLQRASERGMNPARIDALWLRYRVHASNLTNDVEATTSSMAQFLKRHLERGRSRDR
jgi:glycosyltransferase involved in cell wall biosynthesis